VGEVKKLYSTVAMSLVCLLFISFQGFTQCSWDSNGDGDVDGSELQVFAGSSFSPMMKPVWHSSPPPA